jgi:replicative DNA helicase
MADDKLTSSLQLSVLAALCFDQGHGAAIAAQVRAEHFDGVWRDFAARVLNYRKRYGKPPGDNYVDDLAAQATLGRDGTLLKKQLLPKLFAEAAGLNAEYAASRATQFIRKQTIKGALFEAGDRFAQDNEDLVGDVEAILRKALQTKQQAYDAGTFLNDPAGLRFTSERDDIIPIGIPELDRMRIGLVPKQLLLYLGPKGSGKTWFCVHCGKQALLQRMKVVHYSLEMDETEVIQRYYQSLFGAAQTPEKYNQTMLEFDDIGRLSGFKTKKVKPRLDFTEPMARKTLLKKMGAFGARFGGLLVKSFPTASLTISQMTSHLDYLEDVEGFVPNLLIVDYPKLMHMNRDNLRVELGRNMEELRGVGVKRNMAVVAPHQGSRKTIGAKRTKSKDAGEDISVVQTADTVLAFSRTEAEERLGLGRLSVEHARSARGGETVLLSQSYDTGQYVLNSALMQQAYWDRMRAVAGPDDDNDS